MDLKRWITPDRAVWLGSILALAAYCRDLRYDFILDDEVLILLNGTIDSWHNWKLLFLTDIIDSSRSVISSAIHYRPVYMMWLMINSQVFGKITPWWHLTSLLLHLAVTLLVYCLGAAVLKDKWTAALGALFFALHPIHVESVAYISASADLLVACFALVSLLAYHRFRQEGGHFGWLIVSLIASALAMFSKENGLMLPWLVVAYEVFQGSQLLEPAGRHPASYDWRNCIARETALPKLHFARDFPSPNVITATAMLTLCVSPPRPRRE